MAKLEMKAADVIDIQGLVDSVWEERAKAEASRDYLGASALTHGCERMLWLEFRYVVRKEWEGRMLRLFETGRQEEANMVRNLKDAGITVEFTGEDQMELDFGAFIKSHPDGLITSGVPGAEKTKHNWENKTMNKAQFEKLEKEGCKAAKKEHYDQQQLEMLGSKKYLGYQVDRSLYTVLCKDNSKIYAERIKFDKEYAEKLLEHGKRITLSERIPPKLSEDPNWFACKGCSCWTFCHLSHTCQTVTCRSCIYGHPTGDSQWICGYFDDSPVPSDVQRKGCRAHVFHEDLVPYRLVKEKCTDTCAAWEMTDGRIVMNGDHGVDSRDLHKESFSKSNEMIEEHIDF